MFTNYKAVMEQPCLAGITCASTLKGIIIPQVLVNYILDFAGLSPSMARRHSSILDFAGLLPSMARRHSSIHGTKKPAHGGGAGLKTAADGSDPQLIYYL